MAVSRVKKICFISHGLEGGGMERALVSLANYFAEKGHQIAIINIYRTGVFFDLNPTIKLIWPQFERNHKLFYVIRLIPYLRKEIVNFRPDSILSFGETFNAYTVLATRFLNSRVILTNRMWPTLSLRISQTVANWILYRFADGVIAQTKAAKEIIEKKSPNKNITVIPNAVQPVNVKTRTSKNQIVSVGRLSEAKGHTILIKAFALLKNNDWTLHLVGDGPQKQNLREETVKSGLSEKVVFHGHLKDFSNILSESDIFVLPSLNEGFPNALLEAMSVPLACVSSNCIAGPSDIIEHGRNGLLFEPGNVNELADILEQLINDSSLRNKMAAEAYKVRDTFSFNKIAEKYLDFILGAQ
ncbi:MAG: glycosyltransferase family 4 protein [Bacteroidales bacterium]